MTSKRRIIDGDAYVRVTNSAGKIVFLGCIKDWDVNDSGLDWAEVLRDFSPLSRLYVGVGGTQWKGWSLERIAGRESCGRWTSARAGELRRLVNEGKSGYQIADIMGIPASTIYARASQLNISFTSAKARLKEKKERLKREYERPQ